MGMKEIVISIDRISKSFDDVKALNDVSIDIKQGIYGLIGPNGAGKTTLLKILLGIIRPDYGSAMVLDMEISKDILGIKERIGVLHEKPVYPNTLTPMKYLQYVRGIYSSTRNLHELLRIVGLQNAEHRVIGKLSAGMLQRLGLAQALVGNPELVFLDEPTANLDVIGRDEISKLIIDLHNESGVSFVITSHILSELEVLCHEIGIINKGRVVSGGSLPETVDQLTRNLFKIISSDSKALFEFLRTLEFIKNTEITGANSIRFRANHEQIEEIEKRIREIAQLRGIKIYSIERADNLDDAFREAIASE